MFAAGYLSACAVAIGAPAPRVSGFSPVTAARGGQNSSGEGLWSSGDGLLSRRNGLLSPPEAGHSTPELTLSVTDKVFSAMNGLASSLSGRPSSEPKSLSRVEKNPTRPDQSRSGAVKRLPRLDQSLYARPVQRFPRRFPLSEPPQLLLFTHSRSMPVNALTPGQNYSFQVRAIGGSTGYSDWSNPVGHMSM